MARERPIFETPLPHQVFYILLALQRGESYGYEIAHIAVNDSLRHISLPTGSLYPLLRRLTEAKLIEPTDIVERGKSDTPRKHYRITEHGTLLLKEEFLRVRHAYKIGESLGMFHDELPIEIQR
jgi:DNA-binding PadR family transcriptional regulator